jgi:hypothetical protein
MAIAVWSLLPSHLLQQDVRISANPAPSSGKRARKALQHRLKRVSRTFGEVVENYGVFRPHIAISYWGPVGCEPPVCAKSLKPILPFRMHVFAAEISGSPPRDMIRFHCFW